MPASYILIPSTYIPMSGNLLTPLGTPPDREVFQTLVETSSLKVERIVSTGQSTPPGEWFNQQRDEWVALLTGSATIRFESPDEVLALTPGDWLLIPAHRRHRVEQTATDHQTVWIAVHFQGE